MVALGAMDPDEDLLLRAAGLRLSPPSAARTEADALPAAHPLDDREDLRDLRTVAVDEPWTADPDDALSFARTDGGLRVWVHITAASEVLPAGGAIDRAAFEVNTMGPVRMLHALVGNLRASAAPRLVTITSQMGALSLDMTLGFAYSATKAALNKFMKLAAIELGKEGINVCVIHPGWVQTDMGGAEADITPQESARGIVLHLGATEDLHRDLAEGVRECLLATLEDLARDETSFFPTARAGFGSRETL